MTSECLSHDFIRQRSVYIYKLLGQYTLVRQLKDDCGPGEQFDYTPVCISSNGSISELGRHGNTLVCYMIVE